MAAVGIIAIVCGSFVLTAPRDGGSFPGAFLAMVRSRGSRYMLIVAFLFSIALNFDRKVLANSDQFFAGGITLLCLGSIFFVLLQLRRIPVVIDDQSRVLFEQNIPGKNKPPFIGSLLPFLVIALLLSVGSISIYTALLTQIVPCVIAIKRMSILFAVLYGVVVLHEPARLQRVFGASCMVSGAILIAFSS
jgi:drug/metabolite transporter (DMT)-like permease